MPLLQHSTTSFLVIHTIFKSKIGMADLFRIYFSKSSIIGALRYLGGPPIVKDAETLPINLANEPILGMVIYIFLSN